MPGDPTRALASMGNYIFSCRSLLAALEADAPIADELARLRQGRHPRDGQGPPGLLLRLHRRTACPGEKGPNTLLARRRHDRGLLRRQHGPPRRRAGVQPLQPALADPDGAATTIRRRSSSTRKRTPDRPRAQLDGLRRLDPVRAASSATRSSAATSRSTRYAEVRRTRSSSTTSRSARTRSVRRAIIDKNVKIPDGAQIGVGDRDEPRRALREPGRDHRDPEAAALRHGHRADPDLT